MHGKLCGMQKRNRLPTMLWLIPMLLQSMDAHAWGLLTHVYFAQWMLWTLPLADPNLRRAVRRFPELVLGGACLPDLSLISPAFRHTHQWDHIHAMLRAARNDEESAVAVGYASHLLVDVVAHNHFVPAHEAMWLEDKLLTHVLSEWAVDAHLAPMVETTPYELLEKHHAIFAQLMARHFRCSEQRALTTINRLAKADNLLRKVALPYLLYHTFRSLDQRVLEHFTYYIAQTQAMLQQIHSVLDGVHPSWDADPIHEPQLLKQLRRRSLVQLQNRQPDPLKLFAPVKLLHNNMKDIFAINAPIAAPASTSLG